MSKQEVIVAPDGARDLACRDDYRQAANKIAERLASTIASDREWDALNMRDKLALAAFVDERAYGKVAAAQALGSNADNIVDHGKELREIQSRAASEGRPAPELRSAQPATEIKRSRRRTSATVREGKIGLSPDGTVADVTDEGSVVVALPRAG